jgi:hypothetical protein
MNEILSIFGTIMFIIFFRYMSWLQLILIGFVTNILKYCYSNKKSLKKFIKKQSNELNLKKAFVIIAIGIPIIMIDLFTKLLSILQFVWALFIKTNLGKAIDKNLNDGDIYIKKKKAELKSKAIQFIIKKSMPGLSGSDSDGKMPPFGDMKGIGELLNNPEEMGRMMESFGKIMGNLNTNDLNKMNNNILSENKKDNKIDNDLFNKINKYMEDDTTSINVDSDSDKEITIKKNREKLKERVQQTKGINRKIRRRMKKKKNNKINSNDFNNMKDLTLTLQDLVKQMEMD